METFALTPWRQAVDVASRSIAKEMTRRGQMVARTVTRRHEEPDIEIGWRVVNLDLHGRVFRYRVTDNDDAHGPSGPGTPPIWAINIHGYFAGGSMYARESLRLAQRLGWRVVNPSLPGFGGSAPLDWGHPGSSPTPSGTDEQTFMRVFGKCDWAVLFVLSRTNQTYARLRFNVGPGGDLDLPVEVDYTQPFAASDHAAWLAEYQLHVSAEKFTTGPALLQPAGSAAALSTGNDWFGQFQGLEPWEKQMLLDDFEVESLSGSFGHGRGDEGGYEL